MAKPGTKSNGKRGRSKKAGPAKGNGPAAEVTPLRTRLRFAAFPEVGSGLVPYANSREELRGLCLGEKTAVVIETKAWDEVMRPLLAQLDAARPRKGPAPAYTSEELEACLLYQRLAGKTTWEAARSQLAGDRGADCRAALGFDKPRQRVGRGLRVVKTLDGVPSEASVRRHRNRWGQNKHLAAYRELFERIVAEHFEEFPEFAREARLVHWDGSVMLSHYTSFERVDYQTGEVLPPTLSGGGYMKRNAHNAGKDGHGYNLITAVTQTGVPLAARLTAINTPEAKTAEDIIKREWSRVVAPWLDQDTVGVMAFDGAYTGRAMRRAVHEAGYVPNCHGVSHARRESSQRNAKAKDAIRRQVEDKPWWLNGHHELVCECGQGKTIRRARRGRKGKAIAWLEGTCPNCGPVSLTAGQWRIAQGNKQRNKPDKLVKVQADEKDAAEWRIGNPLTYHDPISNAYGSARFAHNEGFHGTLVTRFGLLKEKSWYRDRRDAERDVLQVYCSMHALAMEQRRRAAQNKTAGASTSARKTIRRRRTIRATRSGPPPPDAAAAA